MEFNSKYIIEIAPLEAVGNLRPAEPLKIWIATVEIGDGYAPGLSERFVGDSAFDAARRACEYIVELENRH